MKRPWGCDRRSALLLALAGLPAARLVRAQPALPPRFDVLDLKTAIVGKIAEFVRWPLPAGLVDPHRPFEFVVLGDTPLEPYFTRYYGGQRHGGQGVSIAGHRVFLRRARSVSDIGRPHLLFVGPTMEDSLDAVLSAIGRLPVLTVGDTQGYANRGLAVNLYLTNDQVRFEISRRAFERHGLTASYRLLGLARLIDDQQARR